MATPSPISPENEKSKRYDRQLRLWGENGQLALESSHVCLINANTVGTEILKSLVLPGIRAFTIIDNHKVTENDQDSNFFLCAEGSLGQSRAKVAAQMLIEMNDDVKKGDFLEENFETLLDQNDSFFTNFTLVIACGIDNERSVNKLSQTLWNLNVPLLLVKSVGYLGYIRLQIREHNVLEPHPDNTLEDLRLDFLFPELKEYLDSFPVFGQMTRKELSRVPSLVVIYKNLLKWREQFEIPDEQVPQNYNQKKQLIMLIRDEIDSLRESFSSKPEESDNGDSVHAVSIELENFDEAIKLINKVFVNAHKVPEGLQSLLSKVDLNDQTKPFHSSFWVMVTALKKFIDKCDCLPLRGTIPDMNCGSEQYVQLQKIYKEKAKRDVEKLLILTQKIPKLSTVNISESDVQLVCKNAPYLSVIRTGPIYEELGGAPLRKLVKQLQNTADEDGSELGSDELRFYLLMRLVDRFYSKQNRFPGQREDEVESDISELKREFKDFFTDLGCNVQIKDELIHEICRYGGCELHSISAFLGGCAAHEAIKLITNQYVSIDNTFVYNGLNCITHTFTL